MGEIRALVFDLDNTLYDYYARHDKGYEELSGYAQRELGFSREGFDRAYDRTMDKVTEHLGKGAAAIHDRYVRFQILLEDAHLPLSPHALAMVHAYWDTFLEVLEPFAGVREALSSLKREGYTLGIGTNMLADYQLLKLEKMDLLGFFDFMVSSEEAGAEKPEKEFFWYCLGKAGCRPEECLFIGDDLTLDVKGAKEAGLHALWVQKDEAKGKEAGVPFFWDYGKLEEILRERRYW